jgi:hypothetical protein
MNAVDQPNIKKPLAPMSADSSRHSCGSVMSPKPSVVKQTSAK